MTITVRIAAAGGREQTRLPIAAFKMKDMLRDDGSERLDEAKCQRAVAEMPECFTLSSRDNQRVYWTAFTFLENLHDAIGIVEEKNPDVVSKEPACKQDEIVQRRFDKGKFVFVRIKVGPAALGVRVAIEVNNPYNVVGLSEAQARQFAVAAVQIFQRIADDCKQMLIIDTVAADDILAEAKRNNRASELRRVMANCERCHNGYCTPAKFDCPCFDGGKCELPKEFV